MHLQTVIMPSFVSFIPPDKFNGFVDKGRITWFWTPEDTNCTKRKYRKRYASYNPYDIRLMDKSHDGDENASSDVFCLLSYGCISCNQCEHHCHTI